MTKVVCERIDCDADELEPQRLSDRALSVFVCLFCLFVLFCSDLSVFLFLSVLSALSVCLRKMQLSSLKSLGFRHLFSFCLYLMYVAVL